MLIVRKTYTKLGIHKSRKFQNIKQVLQFMEEDLRDSGWGSYDAAQAFDDREPLVIWEIMYELIEK